VLRSSRPDIDRIVAGIILSMWNRQASARSSRGENSRRGEPVPQISRSIPLLASWNLRMSGRAAAPQIEVVPGTVESWSASRAYKIARTVLPGVGLAETDASYLRYRMAH